MAAPEDHDVDVAIIGGGISGFALAAGLQQNGSCSVRVYERDLSLASRPQGYSLTLQQPAKKALASLDLLERVRENSRVSFGGSGQKIVDACRSGSDVLVDLGGSPGGRPHRGANIFIPREELRLLLKEEFEQHGGSVEWGRRFVEHSAEQGGVVARFEDGLVVRCQLIVACDGVGSVVRDCKLGGVEAGDGLHYLGVGAINGITTRQGHPLCSAGNLQVLDGKARMFCKPFEGGACMWQITFPLAETEAIQLRGLDKEMLRDTAMQLTSGWNEEFRALIEDTDLARFRGGALFDREPDGGHCLSTGSWRVAIVGDAAHPMSPFKGQGANQALVDAVELAGCLSRALHDGADAEVELVAFHRAMDSRVRPMVQGSRDNVEYYHPIGVDNRDEQHLWSKFGKACCFATPRVPKSRMEFEAADAEIYS